MRWLASLALHFYQQLALLYSPNKELAAVISQTCLYEFSTAIPHAKQRVAFINNIHHVNLQTPERIRAILGIMVPAEKFYIVDAIEQDLAILKQAKPGTSFRRTILHEGKSGTGKSSLCKAIL